VKEHRRFPRLNVAVDVQWEKLPPKKRWGLRTDAHATKNISAGGICLIVYEDVEVGEQLSLDIELPSQKVIHAKGRVVWVSPFEVSGDEERKRSDVGIEFTQIAKEDREVIQRFIWTNPTFPEA
jgi:c-di-GMP-binding flagellar brake protein YcgR